MAIIGPGAVQDEQAELRPTLEGASEYEFVTILNPLTDDFAIRVAQDIPVNMPMEIRNKTGLVKEEGDIVRAYGLDLKNPDFQGRRHITNDVVIKAGQTINLKGNEAQVAVRQLVNEIAQREHKTRLLSDPYVRKEIEDRIIKGRGSVQDLLEGKLRTPSQQINEAINQSNEVNDADAFPGLQVAETDPSPGSGTSYTPDNGASQPKRMGRPKKADS